MIAASEIKALFAARSVERFNPAAIRSYSTYQFSISPHTPFDGILQLSPGCHITAIQVKR